MTTIASLLIDGHLVIDSSTLETYADCPTKFNYSAVEKRILNSSRAVLSFGSAVHSALEARYKIAGREEASPQIFDAMLAAGKATLEKENVQASDYRNEGYLENLLRNYNVQVGREPFDIAVDPSGNRIVERPFAIKLGEVHHQSPNLPNPLPVVWTGRIDMVVKFDDGSLSTFDNKTSSMGGDYYFDEYRNSQPQIGYLWAVRQHVDPNINTFIINALICRKPKADGSVNFEFARKRFYVDDSKINEWRESVLSTVQHIILCDQLESYPMTMKSCVGKYGSCPYLDLCTIPKDGRAQVLSSSMFRDNTWTPLH